MAITCCLKHCYEVFLLEIDFLNYKSSATELKLNKTAETTENKHLS